MRPAHGETRDRSSSPHRDDRSNRSPFGTTITVLPSWPTTPCRPDHAAIAVAGGPRHVRLAAGACRQLFVPKNPV